MAGKTESGVFGEGELKERIICKTECRRLEKGGGEMARQTVSQGSWFKGEPAWRMRKRKRRPDRW